MAALKIHGNAAYVIGGIPDHLDYPEHPANTVRRLDACKVKRGSCWKYAREKLAETGLYSKGEETKELRFLWHRLHFPPLDVYAKYLAWKENPDAEIPRSPEPSKGVARGGIEEDAGNVAVEAVQEVAEPQNLEVVAENTPIAVSSGGESKLSVSDFEPTAPLDRTMDIDRSIPEGWSLERFLSVALWVTKNAQHVLTKRVKIKDCPWPECWFFVEVALSNPAGFLSRVVEKVIEYDRAKSAEAKAEVGRLVDGGGELKKLLTRLEKNADLSSVAQG